MPDVATGVNPGGGAAAVPAAPSPGAGAVTPSGENPTPTQGPSTGAGTAVEKGPVPYERFYEINTKYQTAAEKLEALQKQFDTLVQWGQEAYPVWDKHRQYLAEQQALAGQNMDPSDRVRQEILGALAEQKKTFQEFMGVQSRNFDQVALQRGYADVKGQYPWIFESQEDVDLLADAALGMGYRNAPFEQKPLILLEAAKRLDAREKRRQAKVFEQAKKNEAAAANVEGSAPAPIEGVEDLKDRPDEGDARHYFRKVWEKTRPR